ncbi:Cullin binding-domain-containing protein, partial [Xylariales sp. PMI_506]
PDTIGPNGAMNYLTSIGVNLEDASLFVALQIIKAESLGEIKKEGFVSGWKETNVTPSIPSQKSYLATVVSNLSNSPDSFKKVYRHTFDAGKEGGQRALTLDNALIYWDMLFKSPGLAWVGKQSQLDWFAQWTAFLKEKYSRTVSKDMWNMTLEFALKSIEDESLSFWSEDGAWPGVIDDFVAWYRAKSPGAAMDVDA